MHMLLGPFSWMYSVPTVMGTVRAVEGGRRVMLTALPLPFPLYRGGTNSIAPPNVEHWN